MPHDYWEERKSSIARKGPIHLMVHTLQGYGIQPTGPLCWQVGGRVYDIQNQHGLQEAVAQQVKDTLWGRIAAKRTGYQGMTQGRDDAGTTA